MSEEKSKEPETFGDETILDKQEQTVIDEFLEFINYSISPYHAVEATTKILAKNGFKKLDERKDWGKLEPGNYFFTRDQSTICIFCVPKNWNVGEGFTIMGAHTDSPVWRVKPKSKKCKEKYIQVGVEKYGGGLWHTWFDRDLSLGGRVIIECKDDNGKESFESRLVRINRPILRIPTLAIHLSDEGGNSFKFNLENETVPMFATEAGTQLNSTLSKGLDSDFSKDHHPMLLRLLGKELKVDPNKINDFELYLHDTQKSCQGGGLNEFIFSPRLDNLCSCFVVLKSMLNSIKSEKWKNSKNIRMGVFFDNEEIGSTSNRGANSNLVLSTLKRICAGNKWESAIAKSILVSADMAHAVHPNYAGKHENDHKPMMHNGLVIKYNCNQRYATNILSSFHLIQCAKKTKTNLQKFVVKNSSRCGSTIGPYLAGKCGIRTVDVGIPQLSMHSIREVCGVKDVCTTVKLLTEYYDSFEELDQSLKAD